MNRLFSIGTDGKSTTLPQPCTGLFSHTKKFHTALKHFSQAFNARLSAPKVSERNKLESLVEQLNDTVASIVQYRDSSEYDLPGQNKRLKVAEAALKAINAGVLSLERLGIVTSVTPTARLLLGSNQYPVRIGFPIWMTVDPESSLGSWMADRLHTPEDAASDTFHVSSERYEQSFSIEAKPLLNEENTRREIVFVLKAALPNGTLPAPAALSANSAKLNITIENFSHDISNCLSTIKVFVGLFPLKKDRPGFMDRFNRIVPQEIQRMEKMLSDLCSQKAQIDSNLMES